MFSSNLQKNIKEIKKVFSEDSNLLFREFMTKNNKHVCLVFFENLTDSNIISENIIKTMLKSNITNVKDCFNTISCSEMKEVSKMKDVILNLMKGSTFLFIDGESFCVEIVVKQWDKRAITEPPTSAVLKGPRSGFTESINTNITQIRLRLSTPKLTIKMLNIGTVTNTQVAVMYIDNIADKNIVKKVIEKLKKIKIDGIIDSYYIEQLLEEKSESLFKQIGNSEKPDIVAGKMLEGRIAIIVDGSPMVLTLPFVLLEDLQSSDDYYTRSYKAILMRFIRFFGVLVAVLLPGIYVAVQLYHYRVIPLRFLVTIVNATKGLPMTPFVEILFVIILFEILYEASLRMPRYLGMVLSIVGALILGDTAVKAGLISSPSVMIVSLSGITFYTVPEQNVQLAILRIFFTLVGGIMGLLGIIAGGIFVASQLCDMDSYGAPYLAPFAPFIKEDQKDFLIKENLKQMKTLPKSIPNKKVRRQ